MQGAKRVGFLESFIKANKREQKTKAKIGMLRVVVHLRWSRMDSGVCVLKQTNHSLGAKTRNGFSSDRLRREVWCLSKEVQ